MEVFVEGGPHDAIIVDLDPEFGSDFVEIGVVLLVSALVADNHQVSSTFHILDEVSNFLGAEILLGGRDNEQVGFLDFLELDGILVESDLELMQIYFVHFLVLLGELLEVGARVAVLLLRGVEDYLNILDQLLFFELHSFLNINQTQVLYLRPPHSINHFIEL